VESNWQDGTLSNMIAFCEIECSRSG